MKRTIISLTGLPSLSRYKVDGCSRVDGGKSSDATDVRRGPISLAARRPRRDPLLRTHTREAPTGHRMMRHVPQQARAPISERPAGPLAAQCLAVSGGDAMGFFVGVDWGSQAHAVCVIDETG